MSDVDHAFQPDRHCLLIDRGSSRLKWMSAIWSARSGHWDLDLTTFGDGSTEDLEDALASGEMLPPEEVLLISVRSGTREAEVRGVLADRISATVIRLQSEAETLGVRNGYREFEKLGADRWMAVIAGAHFHGTPLVVMDLGTATTLDAVDHRHRHLGGLILPGPGSMREALKAGTALDPGGADLHGRAQPKAGQAQTDTEKGIDGGIVTAQLGALDQFIAWFRERLGNEAQDQLTIIVTGGGAGAILRSSDYQLTHDPLLVFKGMLLSRYGPDELQVEPLRDHFMDER